MAIAGIDLQLFWTIFVFLVVFNFMPICIAMVTRHPQRGLIAVLNVLSLFSFALWLALMAWVVNGERDDTVIARFINNPRYREFFKLGIAGIACFSIGATTAELGLI
jgi:uncharacterized membrane protein